MKLRPSGFKNIFFLDSTIATINLTPGVSVYGEKLIRLEDKEYRQWDFTRSKPAAAIKKKLKVFPLEEGQTILYLGVGSGTTCSHFSDIVGINGLIYGIDIAEKPMIDLIKLSETRNNVVPILADCRKIDEYKNFIVGKVDFVYEDVADPQQIDIFIRNCDVFLKEGGHGAIAIKSQSIDVIKNPREVYRECLQALEKHFIILDKVELDPYERFHLFVVVRKK
jgi:fibrillarin-like pre-rRNA processing protein